MVHSAGIQGRDGAKQVLTALVTPFPGLRLIWADGGYAGKLVAWVATVLQRTLAIVKRPQRTQGFRVLQWRGIVDNTFQWLVRQFEEQMIVLSDTAFHAAEGDPTNLKLCQRGEWEDRMLVETVLSMLTLVCHCKKVMHRVWTYFHARLAFTMAAFNVLVQWHGFQPYASGFVPLSIAEFSL